MRNRFCGFTNQEFRGQVKDTRAVQIHFKEFMLQVFGSLGLIFNLHHISFMSAFLRQR